VARVAVHVRARLNRIQERIAELEHVDLPVRGSFEIVLEFRGYFRQVLAQLRYLALVDDVSLDRNIERYVFFV
jgi:hypothetical protein